MATIDELRSAVLALPDTEEGTHFHLPSFKVNGKPIVGVDKSGVHASFRLDKESIHRLVAADPERFSEVWQTGQHLIGVQAELGALSAAQVAELVELAWRTKAPKRLIAAYEEKGRT